MTDSTASGARGSAFVTSRRTLAIAALVVLVVAMGLSTKVVGKNSSLSESAQAFDPAKYGAKQFPIQQKAIAEKAVVATTLATDLKQDQTQAAAKYGVSANGGAATEVPVTFTGVVGKVPSVGYTPVKVAGLTGGTQVNVQLGPAIVGTDLRDATGKIQLGGFENQIEFQNAGTAINDESKKMLTKAGAPDLSGKSVTVTGVFPLVNPKLWNVTASELRVKQ